MMDLRFLNATRRSALVASLFLLVAATGSAQATLPSPSEADAENPGSAPVPTLTPGGNAPTLTPASNSTGPAFPPAMSPASAPMLGAPGQPANAVAPAPIPAAPGHGGDMVGPVKLRNESIDQVLSLLERWTGRSLLRPTALPAGNYTLTLEQAVTRDEAIVALETLLNLNGVALSPMGEKYLVVSPLNLARTEAPFFIEGAAKDLPASGRVAQKIFTLQFLRVNEFLPQVASLLNPGLGAAPVLFEKSNSALITDSVANLQRIEAVLERVDKPIADGTATKFYNLRSGAKASDVVNQLRTLLSGPLQSQLGASTSYQADDRTNQIILISDPRQQAFFDELVAKLDVQADPNTRNEVIFLKNASAKDIATLLSQLVQGRNKAGGESNRSVTTTAGAPAPGGANVPAPAAIPATPGLESVSTQQFSELLTVLADERSNALIVSGTNDDIRLIRTLVDKIDVLLSQVRIEVVIAEVTLTDEATSGIATLGLNVKANKLVGFSGTGAGTEVANGTATNASDGSTDLAADIKLSTTPRKNNTTILSVPAIVTTHNKEARIFVGEERPVISSFLNDVSGTTNTTSGTGSFGRTTLNEKEIGIELKVKPLIGNDGSVQLEITQEVSDVLGEVSIDGNLQPRVGRRSTQSFISAKSGEILVLGGLQRTTRGKTTNRLGPIPILGDLLGTRKRNDNRTDLVFFLRPYVLTNTPADNIDALRRIDQGPQRAAVRAALDAVADKPKGEPLPKP